MILCDTNGGTLPSEIYKITKEVVNALPKSAVIGIHTHNDTDTAVASSLAAYEAGAIQIQGCVNGYGERTGNANIVSIIGNLKLKMNVDAIEDQNVSKLTELANFVAEKANRRPFQFQPFVGSSAFAHKGGLHASGTEKQVNAYQHIDPGLVGNSNGVVISELSGKSNILNRIKELNLDNMLGNEDAIKIVNFIKDRESKGFSYEGAEASFELILNQFLKFPIVKQLILLR